MDSEEKMKAAMKALMSASERTPGEELVERKTPCRDA